MSDPAGEAANLPELPYDSWKDTAFTLHMWTQMVGKIRLSLSPLVNHWWNVPLYVTSRGLTTSPMPYGSRTLEICFDFIEHKLFIETSDGEVRELALQAPKRRRLLPVADEDALATRNAGEHLDPALSSCRRNSPFLSRRTLLHKSYDADAAHKFWQILVWADSVFKEFRASFIGKVSPVHFFWGSFDLAVTRFSGRRAPERPGADPVTREAYSHEVSSAGFWPGGGDVKGPAFYSYAAPEPAGFAERKVNPPAAYYHPVMKEFLLMYDDVRIAESPNAALLAFLQSTYEAAADLGKWDRDALERSTRR